MDFLLAFTDCFVLSATCRVNWTAWAAVATFTASAVALIVGLTPVVIDRFRIHKRARAIGVVALAHLDWLAVKVNVAGDVISHDDADDHFNYAMVTLNAVEADALMPLIEHADKFNSKITRTSAEAVASIVQLHLKVRRPDGKAMRVPEDFREKPPLVDHVLAVAVPLLALRELLHPFVYSRPAPDLVPVIQRLGAVTRKALIELRPTN